MKRFIKRLLRESIFLFENENSCEYISTTTTGLPDYDDVLDKRPSVFGDVPSEIKYMSPDEYIKRVAEMQESTTDAQYGYIDKNKVKVMVNKMKSGVVYNMPYLDYAKNKGQEGRHRAIAAKESGCNLIPVLVVGEEIKLKNVNNEGSLSDMKWPDLKPIGDDKFAIEYQRNEILPLYESYDEYFLDRCGYKLGLNIPIYPDNTIKLPNFTTNESSEKLAILVKDVITKYITPEDIEDYDVFNKEMPNGEGEKYDDDNLLHYVDYYASEIGADEIKNLNKYLILMVQAVTEYMAISKNCKIFPGDFYDENFNIEFSNGKYYLIISDVFIRFHNEDLNDFDMAKDYIKAISPIIGDLNKFNFIKQYDIKELDANLVDTYLTKFPFKK